MTVRLEFEEGNHEERDTQIEELVIEDPGLVGIDFSTLSKNTIIKVIVVSGYKISKLKLSSISNASNLEEVAIGWTELEELDLSPLSSCSKLKKVEIHSNDYIHSIDLTPLSKCKALEILSIAENHRLNGLNLSPLGELKNLSELVISEHSILDHMDLTPLARCRKLEYLEIEGDPELLEVDITPLVTCTNLWDLILYDNTDHIHLDSDSFFSLHPVLVEFRKPAPLNPSNVIERYVEEYGWDLVEDIYNMTQDPLLKLNWTWRLFKVLGMNEFVGCDGSIESVLRGAKKYDYIEGRDFIFSSLFDLINEQVDNRRSTLFMDITRMSDSRAAVLVPKILELREKEMQSIRLEKNDESIDLLPLALTVNGFRLLAAGPLPRFVSEEVLNQINDILVDIGFSRVSVSTTPVGYSKRVSRIIRDLVCDILHWNE